MHKKGHSILFSLRVNYEFVISNDSALSSSCKVRKMETLVIHSD